MARAVKRILVCVLGALVALVLVAALSLGVVAWQTRTDPREAKLEREASNTKQGIVSDVTELYKIQTRGIIVPHTIEEIAEAVRTHDRVSIGGGRNSMGGQTASTRAVQIDMREYREILGFSTTTKEITVQAGIRWYDIQRHIDPHGLSVAIMQTYSNFTVGGSLSVNVHGRYIGQGPIIGSVKSFRIVLADGSVIRASPTEHADIFYAAIGGYGGLGVISDVTLALADNTTVERSRVALGTEEYAKYFSENVRGKKDVIFHNGDMYPPAFETISAVSWTTTDKEPTTKERLIPAFKDYWKERIAWKVISEWPFGRAIREHLIDPYLYNAPAVHTRNYEASYDIAELEPADRSEATFVLQEYFVPVESFDEWVPKMKAVFDDYSVNVLNVSIRHANADPGSLLAWARKESFAFVVYYKQGTDAEAVAETALWTRAMIDAALSVDGSYYLPYQPWATDEQFHRAYPNAVDYFAIKRQYDPTGKFTNNLWETYYSDEKLAEFSHNRAVRLVASTTPEYFKPFSRTYLSLPEWYIVYAADEYASVLRDGMPSQFPYFAANDEYWRQYDRIVERTASSTDDTAKQMQVLDVIGWSFTVENAVKGVYEATLGRLFERFAGGVQTPEDRYAAEVAQKYATLIYDYPWYDFPYFESLKGVWTIEGEGDYTLGQLARRVERKVFLTLEYGLKSVYAGVIAWVTHLEFGVQDDVINAIVTRDGLTYELISAPHYQPFTRLLLQELRTEASNPNFEIVEIAGNAQIALTYRDQVDAPSLGVGEEITRNLQIEGITDGAVHYSERVTTLVAVRDLTDLYKELSERGITIDHVYDY